VNGGDHEPKNLFVNCWSSLLADRRGSLTACRPRSDFRRGRRRDPHVGERGCCGCDGLPGLGRLSAVAEVEVEGMKYPSDEWNEPFNLDIKMACVPIQIVPTEGFTPIACARFVPFLPTFLASFNPVT
jgi:hypothetical protein